MSGKKTLISIGTSLGESFRLEECYLYYDGPMVWRANQHLFYFVEEVGDITWYLASPCDSDPDLTCFRTFYAGRLTFFVALNHKQQVVQIEKDQYTLDSVLPEWGVGL